MTLDLRLLTPFVVLADELHFHRAAARLHIGQPTLTRQIQQLEQQLGVDLFRRTTRAVHLTPAGAAFLDGARLALASVRSAADRARDAAQPRSVLRVGADIDLPEPLIRRLRRFGSDRPDVQLRVSVQQQDDALRALGRAEVDLVVGWTGPPAGRSLDAVALTSLPLHAVLPRADPLVAAPAVSRPAVGDRVLVSYAPSAETRPFYDALLADLGRDGDGMPSVEHVDVLDDAQQAMLDRVSSGGGFTFCVAGTLDALGRRDVVERPFEPALAAAVVALWRRDHRPALTDDLVRWFAGD